MLLITVPTMPEQLVVNGKYSKRSEIMVTLQMSGGRHSERSQTVQILTIYGLTFIITSLSSSPS